MEGGLRGQNVEQETLRSGFEEMPENRKTDKLGTCGNAPMPEKVRVPHPRENSTKLPLLTQRPPKRKTSTAFFRVKAIGAKKVATVGRWAVRHSPS
jgi:hypothetical protein